MEAKATIGMAGDTVTKVTESQSVFPRGLPVVYRCHRDPTK